MPSTIAHQSLNTSLTTWHITWGTYGARLPGDDRPTVSRVQNKPGDPFIAPDIERARVASESLRGDIVYLTPAQQLFVQDTIPELCIRGGWVLRTCSAAHDHIHVVLDIDPATHSEKVRRLLKRWLGEALSERFGKPNSGTWWAKEGSNKAIHDEEYLNNAYRYVLLQRAQPLQESNAC